LSHRRPLLHGTLIRERPLITNVARSEVGYNKIPWPPILPQSGEKGAVTCSGFSERQLHRSSIEGIRPPWKSEIRNLARHPCSIIHKFRMLHSRLEPQKRSLLSLHSPAETLTLSRLPTNLLAFRI